MRQADRLRSAATLSVATAGGSVGQDLAGGLPDVSATIAATGHPPGSDPSLVDGRSAPEATSPGDKAGDGGYDCLPVVEPRLRMPRRPRRTALARGAVLWILLVLMSAAVWDKLRMALGDGAISFVIVLLAFVTILPFFGEHER